MKKAKQGLVALVVTATFGVVHAANWVPLPLTSDAAVTHYFLDSDSIKKFPDGSVAAWSKAESSTPQVIHGTTTVYISVKSLNRYYCANRQFSAGPTMWYGADGNVVSSDTTYTALQDVVPDSIGDGLTTAACSTVKWPRMWQ
ncbi:surface-adhesin E family protein [Paraburkholderia caledonica]|uniref:surface-adhesin E family protein n=1 Tax=Paraburkholderia caledonica TaxID=134536 RepID=UPI000DEEE37C|nr:surface-adhesin E family protein [Paraburkholderia caledonica]AXF14573.1 hypothetical protein CUJ87_09295 [Paraburkholderia caledonica]